jgi:hypothetical protein
MAARGFLGAGDLYIARFASGVAGDYEGPFECTKFEIKPNVEVKEQVSKGRSTYGQVIESVPVPKPAVLTVDLAEVNDLSLALALFGTTSALAQSSGTISNQAIVVALGKWKPLTVAAFSAAPVVTDVAGTTTYVAGVDYLFNPQLGWIKALVGGAITDGQTVHIDGSYDAIAGFQIAGQTQTQVRARFKLDGINFADDLPVIATVHEAIIAADSAFDFLGSDFNTVSLPGRMKTPTGYNEPFTVHLRTA